MEIPARYRNISNIIPIVIGAYAFRTFEPYLPNASVAFVQKSIMKMEKSISIKKENPILNKLTKLMLMSSLG